MMSWVIGAVAVLLALLGAVLASRALDVGMLTFGFGLVAFGCWLVFWLMKDHWDEIERDAQGAGTSDARQ